MLRVLVFGTFDGVHDGHRAMLKQARTLSHVPASATRHAPSATNYLIIAVAPDSIVSALKGKQPFHASAQRIAMLKKERLADEVIIADSELHSWQIIKKYKPSIIALGYDQEELRASLEAHLDKSYPDVETAQGEWQSNPKRPKIVILSAHQPEKYHNRIMKHEL